MNDNTASQTLREAAFLAGEQANFDGELRGANPHAEGPAADSWGCGWDAAQRVRDEWEIANHERAQQAEWLEGADLA